MAWILEKFHGWSDVSTPGGLFKAHSKDDLLTNISLYWFSGCITSSARMYYESLGPFQSGRGLKVLGQKVEIPCGIALFKQEPFASHVREWVELRYNVRRWFEHPTGGHFAAREEPTALVDDVKAFVFESLTDGERPKVSPSSKL